MRWMVRPDGSVVVRPAEQLFPLQEPEPMRVAVLPYAPVAVADREQLLPKQLPLALNELVPRGPDTLALRDHANASVTIEMAGIPVRAAVVMMPFM